MEPRVVYSTTPQQASGVQSLIARIPGATTLGGYLAATATKAIASGSSSPAAGEPPNPAPRPVGCLKFEKWPASCSRDGREHVALLIGHTTGFEVWDLGPDGAGHHGRGSGGHGGASSAAALQLAAATTSAPVRGLCFFGSSDANSTRPRLAVSTYSPSFSVKAPLDADTPSMGGNSGSAPWLVRAYDMESHAFEDAITDKENRAAPLQFEVPVHGILGSLEVLLVYTGAAVHGFRASNLQLVFSVPAVPPHPTSAAAASAACLALGPRWLAFPSASAPKGKNKSSSSRGYFTGSSVGDCDAGDADDSDRFEPSSGSSSGDGGTASSSGAGLVGTAQGVVGGLYWLGAKSKRAADDYLAHRQQQQELQQQQQRMRQQQQNFPSQPNAPSQQTSFSGTPSLPTPTVEQAAQAAADAAELAWQNYVASLGEAPGTVAFLDISSSTSATNTSSSSSSPSLSPSAGVIVSRLRAHHCNDPLEAMAWSRCGRSLVTAPRSGQTLHLWAVANDHKTRLHRTRRRGRHAHSGSRSSSNDSATSTSAANSTAGATTGTAGLVACRTRPPAPRFVLVHKLVRGLTPASVRSLALSGLWCAVATGRGTVHLFGVDPRLKGGAVDGRAHTDPPPPPQQRNSSHRSAVANATPSALGQSPGTGSSGGISPGGSDPNNKKAGSHGSHKDEEGTVDGVVESDDEDYDLVTTEEGTASRSNDESITPASLASLARVRPLPGDYSPASSGHVINSGYGSSGDMGGAPSTDPLGGDGSGHGEGNASPIAAPVAAAPADMACWVGGSSLLVVTADGTLRRHTLQPSVVRCAVPTNSSKASPQEHGSGSGSGSGHIHHTSNHGSFSSSPGMSTSNRGGGSGAYPYDDDDHGQGMDGAAADDAAALLAGAPLSQRAVGAAAGAAGSLASALAAGGGRLLSSSPSSYSSFVGSLGSSSRGSSVNRGSSSARDSPLGRSPSHPTYHQHNNSSSSSSGHHHSGKGNSPVLSGSPVSANTSSSSGGGGGGLLGSSPLVAALRANFRGNAAPHHRGAVAYKTRLALEVGDVSEWALGPSPPTPQNDCVNKRAIPTTTTIASAEPVSSVASTGAESAFMNRLDGSGSERQRLPGREIIAPVAHNNNNSSNERDWLSLIERRTRPPSVPLWASPQLSYLSVADRNNNKTTYATNKSTRPGGATSSSSSSGAFTYMTDCNPFRFEERGKPSAVKLGAPPVKPRRVSSKASSPPHPPTPPLHAPSPGPEMQFALTDDEEDESDNSGKSNSCSSSVVMPMPTPGSPQGQALSAWETVAYDKWEWR